MMAEDTREFPGVSSLLHARPGKRVSYFSRQAKKKCIGRRTSFEEAGKLTSGRRGSFNVQGAAVILNLEY
jgi:hypothetical protein